MTIGEQLDAALARVAVLEEKLGLVLTYLDTRVVDRLNKAEYDINRLAIGTYTLKQATNMIGNGSNSNTALVPVENTLSMIPQTINSALPYQQMDGRTDLEEQITALEPASSEE